MGDSSEREQGEEVGVQISGLSLNDDGPGPAAPEEEAATQGGNGDREGAASPLQVKNLKRPVIKLTHKLLDTYQTINERWYAKRGQRSQDQWDDENGDYIIRTGDMINKRYKVVKRPNSHSPLLGKGSFGQVVYAIDTKSPDGKKQEVALKIIKNHHHWYEQAKCEIALLKRFTKMEPVETSKGKKDWVEHANVVRLVDDFEHCNHCCLVFELLPFTLYDLLKYSRFKGVSLQLVSRFAHHMLRALSSLRAADVIHADLKPENVMLVAHDDHRVKVIDFGSSCSSKRQPFTYIQSRFYRSPEVLLCGAYSFPIDMWSLGCILAEMHTGQPLFNGRNEAEQIWRICDILGLPPASMIRSAGSKSKVKALFKLDDGKYTLSVNSSTLKMATKSLRNVLRRPAHPPLSLDHERSYMLFEDLIFKMLEFDPEKRITPEDALQHKFLFSEHPSPSTLRAASSSDKAASDKASSDKSVGTGGS